MDETPELMRAATDVVSEYMAGDLADVSVEELAEIVEDAGDSPVAAAALAVVEAHEEDELTDEEIGELRDALEAADSTLTGTWPED
jgi:hypothetical protein